MDQVRDFVIDTGKGWPIIGGAVVAIAIALWLAWVLKEDYKGLAVIAVLFAVGVGIVALPAVPAAKAECRRLYRAEKVTYLTSNCEALVKCQERNGLGCGSPFSSLGVAARTGERRGATFLARVPARSG